MTTTTNAAVTAAPTPSSKASETPAPRTCAYPAGCKKVLGDRNISGLCAVHRSHKSNGHGAAAVRTNAAVGKTNGVDHYPAHEARPAAPTVPIARDGGMQQLAAERAKLLLADADLARSIFAVIPDADKISLCLAWLRGEKLATVGEAAEQSRQTHTVHSLAANSEAA